MEIPHFVRDDNFKKDDNLKRDDNLKSLCRWCRLEFFEPVFQRT